MGQNKRRPRRQPSEKYYTATQVKAILGINESSLYNYVQKNVLKREVPPGKKYGYYLRSEVDQLARELDAFFATRQKVSSVFLRAEKADVSACVEISHAFFASGGYVHFSLANTAERLAWLEKNPDILYVVKAPNAEGQIMGYTSMIPMERSLIEKVLANEVLMKDVGPEDILPFSPGTPLDVYLMAMVVRPGLSISEKRAYGARLISGLMSTIVDMGCRGIVIQNIFARSNTPDGLRLLHDLGFARIPSVTDMQNFVVHVEESGIPALMQYKEALKAFSRSQDAVS